LHTGMDVDIPSDARAERAEKGPPPSPEDAWAPGKQWVNSRPQHTTG
jgi:hypothetical protein